jgi:ABC-type nitrate/sulfonate/bicarbonate transport system permease component
MAIGQALVVLVIKGEFYQHLGITMAEMVIGFSIGAFSGMALGICFGLWRFLGETLDPWVHYLAPTPKIIFLPVLVLAFGAGMGSKIAMGAVSAFFPVVVATFAGMRLVRPVLIRVATTFQASTWQIVRLVYLPSLVGPVLGAMRIGLGATIIGTLLAEIKMSRAGLGYLIIQDYNFFRIPEMYAMLIVIFALAWLANSGMEHLANRLTRY